MCLSTLYAAFWTIFFCLVYTVAKQQQQQQKKTLTFLTVGTDKVN